MDEYIPRKEALAALGEEPYVWDEDSDSEVQEYRDWECHYGAISAIPAADVSPVRHGRWIAQPPDFDLCGVAYYQCSECGKEQQTPANYCQFCGARCDL